MIGLLNLFRSWQIWIVVLLIAAAGGAWIYRGKMLEIVRADLIVTHTALDQANARIVAQNGEVAKWMEEAERQGRLIKAAQQAAQKAQRTSEARTAALLLQPVPKACDQAIRWGASQAAALTADWR